MQNPGRFTSTRADHLTATGQNCWPPAGRFVTATGHDLMAAVRRLLHSGQRCTGSSLCVSRAHAHVILRLDDSRSYVHAQRVPQDRSL